MIPARSRLEDFCKKYGGRKIRPLQATVPFAAQTLQPIRDAVPLILEAQKAILAALLKDLGPAGTLKLFAVPPELAPWMEVLKNPHMDAPMLRADVIVDEQRRAWICEINADSSVGGAEAHQFLRIEETAQGRPPSLSPYDHLASLIGRLLVERECDKVCVLDWSSWEGYGSFGMDWLQLQLRTALPGVDVSFATEKTALSVLDDRTLVYRVFLAQDAITDIGLTFEIFSRAGYALSDFSGDLLGSKIWLALLHEPGRRRLLTNEMIRAIDQTIPFTVIVNSSNLNALIRNKDQFYFKSASDFGGHGVLCGKTSSPHALASTLRCQSGKGWIAQRACVSKPVQVWPLGASAPAPNRVALGLYQIGGHWSGILVRTHADADVINVAAGSTIGWGYEIE